MNKIVILTSILIVCQGISFDLASRCSCSEYDQITCSGIGYCSYVNGSCQPLQCNTLTIEKCDGMSTEYKCMWNSSKSSCEDHVYECSELTELECGQSLYSLDCYWNDAKCQPHPECSAGTKDNCSFFKCSYSEQDGCADPYSGITCDGTNNTTCTKSNGKGDICMMNDKNQCSDIQMFPSSCADYSDLKNMCEISCKYDTATSTCVQKTCADIVEQKDCIILLNLMKFQITPCIWKNSSCSEATDADIQEMSILCIAYTALNYKWDSTSNKCSQCTKLDTNPQYSFMKQQADELNSDQSNGLQIAFSVALIMNILI